MASKSKPRSVKPKSHRNLPRGARHPASLLPFHAHSPALLALVDVPVNMDMIHHVARQCVHAIRVEGEDEGEYIQSQVVSSPAKMVVDPGIPTPPSTPLRTSVNGKAEPVSDAKPETEMPTAKIVPLDKFIAHIVRSSNVDVPILFTTLIYLERLRVKLPAMAKGMPCTRHRVFLATLIVAAKYLNDVSPKNKHWTLHACGLFPLREVNLMERQLLYLLNFDLKFEEMDAMKTWKPFIVKIEVLLLKSPVGVPLTPPYEVKPSSPIPMSISASALRSKSTTSLVTMASPSDTTQNPQNFTLRPVPERAYKCTPNQHLSSTSASSLPYLQGSSSMGSVSTLHIPQTIQPSATMPALYQSNQEPHLHPSPMKEHKRGGSGSFLSRMWMKGFKSKSISGKENQHQNLVSMRRNDSEDASKRAYEECAVSAPTPGFYDPIYVPRRNVASASPSQWNWAVRTRSSSNVGDGRNAPTPTRTPLRESIAFT